MSVTITTEAHATGEALDVTPEEKQPFIVHCRDCKHEWAPFYVPLVMDKKGLALMKNAGKACPKCVGKNVFCGPNLPPASPPVPGAPE